MLLGKTCFEGSYPTLKNTQMLETLSPLIGENMQNHFVHLFIRHLSNETNDIPTSIVVIELPFSLINPNSIFNVHLGL